MATNAAAYGKGLRHILLPNTNNDVGIGVKRGADGGEITRG